VKPGGNLYGGFLFRVFQSKSNNSYFEVSAKGVTRYGLGTEVFLNFLTILPPLEEQTTIAHFLDHKTAQIDAAIDKHRQLIELLQEHRAALINEAVTRGINPDAPMKDSGIEWIGEVPAHWDRVALKRAVITKITDGPHETPEFLDQGIPFISAEGVREGRVDFNYKRGHISPEVHEIYSKKCKPQKGDVFIVKSGSTTGKVAYVDTDIEFNIWSPIALVRPKEEFDGKYLFYFCGSKCFQKQIQLFWSFGTQPNIGMKVLENLYIAVPTVNEQQQIVDYIEAETARIDEEITLARQEIALLEEYRQSLIAEAVTGKIDVRDYPLT
jgi:type I restriction enzyme S subunit